MIYIRNIQYPLYTWYGSFKLFIFILEIVVLDFNSFPFLITISWAYFKLTNKFSPNHSNDPQKN